jgi:mono/diheme cytochrome c family protein
VACDYKTYFINMTHKPFRRPLVLAWTCLSLVWVAPICAADSLHIPRAQLLLHGADVFQNNCTGCHGMDGRGYAGATPPLANSDFLMANRLRPVSIVLQGLDASIIVNGVEYGSTMPAWEEVLTDYDIAAVLTYLRADLNDSTVVSCNANMLDENGFATCQMVARNPAEIAFDSIAVWEVATVRNNPIGVLLSTSRTFRLNGGRPFTFTLPAGGFSAVRLRITDIFGRTVWKTTVRVEKGAREISWNGRTSNGFHAAAGLYLAHFEVVGGGKGVSFVHKGAKLTPH